MSTGGRVEGHANSYQGGPVLSIRIIVSDAGLSVSGDVHDWQWAVAALDNARDAIRRQGLARDSVIAVPLADVAVPERRLIA
jgi:hypothetical protein